MTGKVHYLVNILVSKPHCRTDLSVTLVSKCIFLSLPVILSPESSLPITSWSLSQTCSSHRQTRFFKDPAHFLLDQISDQTGYLNDRQHVPISTKNDTRRLSWPKHWTNWTIQRALHFRRSSKISNVLPSPVSGIMSSLHTKLDTILSEQTSRPLFSHDNKAVSIIISITKMKRKPEVGHSDEHHFSWWIRMKDRHKQ